MSVLRRRWLDLAISVGMALFLTLIVLGDDPGERSPWRALAAAVLGVTSGGALWWRRERPELVFAVTFVAAIGIQLLAPEGQIPFAGLVALGSLAARRPPFRSIPAGIALLALAASNTFTAPGEDTLFAMTSVVAAWALGEASRYRRRALDEAAQRAVGEEQARIARELHDVISHTVSVIVVQAAAADEVFDEHPAKARAALRSIETAGREALSELRLLLADVRPDAGPAQPQPGLARLDELAEPLREAGLEVAVHREGREAPLPTAVDLSAYRIVQEALTNVLRHAGASSADVTVRYAGDLLEVDVRDDGRGGAVATVAGQGIVGMRERAAMLGGTLEAGPLPDGGYRVCARLPLGTA